MNKSKEKTKGKGRKGSYLPFPDVDKDSEKKKKYHKVTSFKLNFRTLAALRAIVRITHCSTHVAALQMAIEAFYQNIPKLFPMVTPEEMEKILKEELEIVQQESNKRGRPLKEDNLV